MVVYHIFRAQVDAEGIAHAGQVIDEQRVIRQDQLTGARVFGN